MRLGGDTMYQRLRRENPSSRPSWATEQVQSQLSHLSQSLSQNEKVGKARAVPQWWRACLTCEDQGALHSTSKVIIESVRSTVGTCVHLLHVHTHGSLWTTCKSQFPLVNPTTCVPRIKLRSPGFGKSLNLLSYLSRHR